MSGSKPACVKSALSAKELWWSAGCSAVSPTALAPPTVPASTAPIINSPGRKKAKPCRGGYRPSTLRSTGNGSPTVSASSRSFSRCTEFHKRPTATCCRLKKPKKAALNQGIFLPHLDNPGVSGHLRGGNAQNHLIFRGFPRCQKVATPKSYGCGQRRFFRTATLHSVQLPVCCFEEGFNRFAVLRIGRHSNACGKWRPLTIRCKPIANARRDKPCGPGVCLGQHDGKLVAPVSRGCVDSPTKQTEHLADAA